jgi:hypothetical protein
VTRSSIDHGPLRRKGAVERSNVNFTPQLGFGDGFSDRQVTVVSLISAEGEVIL